ncbi:MAG: carbohydrate-binding domain-containing protein [bacterium]
MHKKGLFALLLSASLLFSACAGNGTAEENTETTNETTNETTTESIAPPAGEEEISIPAVTVEKPAVTPDESADAVFTADGLQLNAANGLAAEGTALTITADGTYTISGECAEGSIRVDKGLTGVNLVLRELDLTASATAPLVIAKGSAVNLTIEGAVNLTDAEDPAGEDANDDFEGAAIKVKSGAALTIGGTGSLTLDASACKNGLKGGAEAAVTIAGGTLTVTAAGNGIASDGSVTLSGGTIAVIAGNDGVKSDPDEGAGGFVTLSGAALTVEAAGDGVSAAADLTVTGGTIAITAGGGAANGETHAESFGRGGNAAASTDSASAKGLKADGDLLISGGTLLLDTADDAIHADGNVTLTGGEITLSSGDDGIHAEYTLTLGAEGTEDGPNVTVLTSYEALEGADVVLWGGRGYLAASDDGINAANSDLTNYTIALTIHGGDWMVNAGGDGLDAGSEMGQNNGHIYMKGGRVLVYGSADGGNSSFDHDGTAVYSGGTLLAIGNSAMQETFNEGVYVLFTLSSGAIQEGTALEILDEDGNSLAAATGLKSANAVMFAAESVEAGKTYTLTLDGTAAATATAGTGAVGGMGGFGGMGGGRGGFGGGRGQMGGSGEMPQRPEGGMNGEMPQRPEGGFNGEMPQLPEGGFNGEMPQMPGGVNG